jgi:hypothetical protein
VRASLETYLDGMARPNYGLRGKDFVPCSNSANWNDLSYICTDTFPEVLWTIFAALVFYLLSAFRLGISAVAWRVTFAMLLEWWLLREVLGLFFGKKGASWSLPVPEKGLSVPTGPTRQFMQHANRTKSLIQILSKGCWFWKLFKSFFPSFKKKKKR